MQISQTQGQIIFNKTHQDEVNLSPLNGNHKILDEVVEKSQRVLMRVKSTFPFDLFPDVLTIDENKITLVCHELGYENLHSVFIENITYVTVDTAIIHATLNITDSTSERFPVILSIHHLNKEVAFKTMCLIEGLIAAQKMNINFSLFEPKQLVDKLIKLGEARQI